MIVVARESPSQPDVLRLLAASDAESAARYPAESRHGVGLDVLEQPSCRFVVAREEGEAIGCGGIVLDGLGQAEVKRMFVAVQARCRGVARRILAVLEDTARGQGVHTLLLETGIASAAALALYRTTGWTERAAFGIYRFDPLSICMEKRL